MEIVRPGRSIVDLWRFECGAWLDLYLAKTKEIIFEPALSLASLPFLLVVPQSFPTSLASSTRVWGYCRTWATHPDIIS
jgi:hypothetical protein